MARTTLLCAIAICITVAVAAVGPMQGAEAAVTCGSVQGSLAPCLTYLITAGAKPTQKCCDGVKGLLKAAGTTTDRQMACNCLKSSAGKIPNIVSQNAINLPKSCGVSIPYQISPKTNCNSIK